MGIKKNRLHTMLMLLMPFCLWGQGESVGSVNIFTQLSNDTRGGKIVIDQPASIIWLMNKYITINQKEKTIPGWRIRIYSDLGNQARDASTDIKGRFLYMYPDIPVYRQYTAPYYKVYVGDFRTKLEAIRMLRNIKRSFPDAFPVQSAINFPEIP